MADWKQMVGVDRAGAWAGARVKEVFDRLAQENTTRDELLRIAVVALLIAGPDDIPPRLMKRIGGEGGSLREGIKSAGLGTDEMALLFGVALLAEADAGGHIDEDP